MIVYYRIQMANIHQKLCGTQQYDCSIDAYTNIYCTLIGIKSLPSVPDEKKTEHRNSRQKVFKLIKTPQLFEGTPKP